MPWRTMILRGARVLARCDDAGELVTGADGRVEIRYKPGDARAYRAGKRNLEPSDDTRVLAENTCPPAQDAQSAPASGAKSKAKAAEVARARTHEPDAIIVYADGACSGNPGPAGIGVVLQDGKQRRELSMFLGVGTNNVAELAAIYEAALVITEPARPVRMHTDSKYAIGVLTMGWKAKANVELVARVKQALSRLQDLKIIHVPGHAGVPLNERADALAVQAVKSESTTGWIDY